MEVNEYRCPKCNHVLHSVNRFTAIYRCDRCNKDYSVTFNNKGFLLMFVFYFILHMLVQFVLTKCGVVDHKALIGYAIEFGLIVVLIITGFLDKIYNKLGMYEIKEAVSKKR